MRRLVRDGVCKEDLEPSCRLDLICDVNYQKDEIGIELQLHGTNVQSIHIIQLNECNQVQETPNGQEIIERMEKRLDSTTDQ